MKPNIDVEIFYNLADGLSGDIRYWDVEFYNGTSNYVITIYFDPVYHNGFGKIYKREDRVGFILYPGETVETGKFMKPKGFKEVLFKLDNVKIEKQIINSGKRNWKKGRFTDRKNK